MNWFQLSIKWLLFFVGVPTLAYVLLWASIQHTFEIAITVYQMFIGLGLIAVLIMSIYLGIIKLVQDTKEVSGL